MDVLSRATLIFSCPTTLRYLPQSQTVPDAMQRTEDLSVQKYLCVYTCMCRVSHNLPSNLLEPFKHGDGTVCHLPSTHISVGFTHPLPLSSSIPSGYRELAWSVDHTVSHLNVEGVLWHLCIHKQHWFPRLLTETTASLFSQWKSIVWCWKYVGGRTMILNCCIQLWYSRNSWDQLK